MERICDITPMIHKNTHALRPFPSKCFPVLISRAYLVETTKGAGNLSRKRLASTTTSLTKGYLCCCCCCCETARDTWVAQAFRRPGEWVQRKLEAKEIGRAHRLCQHHSHNHFFSKTFTCLPRMRCCYASGRQVRVARWMCTHAMECCATRR